MCTLKQLDFKTEYTQGEENRVTGALCLLLKTDFKLLFWFLKWSKSWKQQRQLWYILYQRAMIIREWSKVNQNSKKGKKVREDWTGGVLEGVVSGSLDQFPTNADQEQPLEILKSLYIF